MKILEVCEFSAGICGVWTRVSQEAQLLAKKHNVTVFSSNRVKGLDKIAPEKEDFEGVQIQRFPVKFAVGENALFWNFEKEALDLKPDVIIAHVYRHPHTNKTIDIAKKLHKQGYTCKTILVTHAPFVEKETRGWKLHIAANMYDLIYKKNLNKFDKIITITQWEEPFLEALGVKKEKLNYIPNGIPELFFTKQIQVPHNKKPKILFLGIIAPIENLENLLRAIAILKQQIHKDIVLEIVGPSEPDYLEILKEEIERLNIQNQVIFSEPIYSLAKKIEKLDSSDVFVLPSKREAMPQALIEAMSREKLVISSDTFGGKEIIHSGKNGFLFSKGNEYRLARMIDDCLNTNNKTDLQKIRKNAQLSVQKFRWNTLIQNILTCIEQ